MEVLGTIEERLPTPVAVDHPEDARGRHAADPGIDRSVHQGTVQQVHLAAGGDASGQELVAPEGHPPVDVVGPQMRLPRPDGLFQPSLQWEAVAGTA